MAYEPKSGRGKINKGFNIDGRKNTTDEINERFNDFAGDFVGDTIKKKITRR
jgi:hypothetical protein